MKCEEFEVLMADALGGELAERDRGAFEEHLARCSRCRTEYEAGRATVRAMQVVSGPPIAASSSSGLETARLKAAPAMEPPVADGDRQRGRSLFRLAPVLRYAAVVAIAFVAGYGVRDASVHTPGGTGIPIVDTQSISGGVSGAERSFESALTSVYRRRPSGSDLGKAMSALFRDG